VTPLIWRAVVRGMLGAVFAIGLQASNAHAADAPFAFATTPGRLPKTVLPLEYTLTITPHPATLTLGGTERVTLDVRRATTALVFNALNLRFTTVRVDGRAPLSVTPNDRTQRTTVQLARALSPGQHVLDLLFTGRLETSGQGMFRQSYLGPGRKPGMLVSTQFEATDARRMFPCWDEPAFRATYALRVVVPAAWQAVSNMPVVSRTTHGATATIAFGRTPKMASYLLEVTAGDLAHLNGIDARGTRHEVWAVRGRERQGSYALANSKAILTDYDRYFGFRFPLPRLASIAVPGGFDGAMENWGAITYNDQILLLGRASTLEEQQDIYATQAHEMAHQWFGDLVTMGWWDNLWLNESFASWMAAKQTDRTHPEWRWWQGQDADKEGAMNADARLTTHPIQQPVADDTDAEAAFDSEITYDKGQAFLRMLEAYLGPEPFRSGIRSYIHDRAYSNATGADLWNALARQSGKPVAAIAHAWIFTPGFPLVSVTATCAADGARTIALHQDRFLLDGTDATHVPWSIPVGIAVGTDAPQYTLLSQRDQTGIAAGRCNQPLRANAGDVGFYRVAYDDATFAVNRAGFAGLPDDDKIALLDDEWALVNAGKARLDAYLTLVAAMGSDANPRAWEQIAGALGAIDRDERGTTGQVAFEAYARGVLAPLVTRLGFDSHHGESPAIVQLRHAVVRDLGDWDDPRALAWAQLQFARVQANRDSVPAGDEAVALRIAGAHADAAAFAALDTLARTARDETEFRRFADALGAVRDPKLATRVLALAISPEIPDQAQSERLALIYAVAQGHPALSYRFLQANAARLFAANSVEDSVFIAQEIPEIYWDAAPVDQIVAWVKAHTPPEASPELARGAERARFHLVSRGRLDAQADALARTGDVAPGAQ
jgi:aminopeptidase N